MAAGGQAGRGAGRARGKPHRATGHWRRSRRAGGLGCAAGARLPCARHPPAHRRCGDVQVMQVLPVWQCWMLWLCLLACRFHVPALCPPTVAATISRCGVSLWCSGRSFAFAAVAALLARNCDELPTCLPRWIVRVWLPLESCLMVLIPVCYVTRYVVYGMSLRMQVADQPVSCAHVRGRRCACCGPEREWPGVYQSRSTRSA